ncbi:uncharacterized protein CTRU02_200868 [Colletotrichum truncatum]|uniref:Uncharacterized protein n=1 Tax=Colletotrichum truncatum TaxID=5467 RepID=A0ACC3ZGC6_COLTU|nr:uncharacterized protein CTRU02_00637 [Colletotrichum truncatum]KAF6801888.1 hypothetical protein CTRU02_00637 [Colletotrichum truncatum]
MMYRRSHRKSRRGCAECKQRHIKCDETQPKCVNCTIVGRACVFPTPAKPKHSKSSKRVKGSSTLSSGGTSPTIDTAPGSSDEQTPAAIPAPELVHLAHRSRDVSNTLSSSPDVAVNMYHMKLLVHFSLDLAIPELEHNLLEQSTRLVLKTGAEVPYLLHEILSLSSRHLSLIEVEKNSEYLNLAVQLQTQAISLFNAQRVCINEVTCVPMVLFSSILGRHLCIDALAFRSPDLGAFLNHYVRFFQIHRGAKMIVNRAWPLLKKSDLCPLMAWGVGLGRLRSHGHHCDGILGLLSVSKDTSAASLETCRKAIEFIQIAMDDVAVRMFTQAKHLYQIVFSWSLLVPESFADMLAQRRPEAIAVLAHYAAILHLARDLWQIGDSGAYLFEVISKHLGAAWEEWIAWPRSIICPNTAALSADEG